MPTPSVAIPPVSSVQSRRASAKPSCALPPRVETAPEPQASPACAPPLSPPHPPARPLSSRHPHPTSAYPRAPRRHPRLGTPSTPPRSPTRPAHSRSRPA
eukprot:2485504-Prymnesium_polylepis.1